MSDDTNDTTGQALDDAVKVFVGTFVDCPELGVLRIRRDHVLVVNEKGYIQSIQPSSTYPTTSLPKNRIHRLKRHQLLLPTFTDLHLHAPQYLYAGTGLDLPLMQWLDEYAYRAEERIDADGELAERVYERLVGRLREGGSGCVVFFGSLGVESNIILARAVLKAGLRGFIGKLSMDQSPRATYGEPNMETSLTSLRDFLNQMSTLTSQLPPDLRLIQPILTPRFVPVCSDELLRSLAQIAEEENIRIQSHMCESRDQMAWVEGTRGKKDEVVFDEAGLLRKGTVQAHVTSLPAELIELCKERGVVAAHCPLSNAYFSDAQFPLREALDAEMSVGLGSDIAGGYALSIQSSMRQAVITSRLREGQRQERPHEEGSKLHGKSLRVDWKESLYVATRGGKKALDLGGCFDVGMEFDAQLIELAGEDATSTGVLDIFDSPDEGDQGEGEGWWKEGIERWWCNGDDRNRLGMWIQGRRVL